MIYSELDEDIRDIENSFLSGFFHLVLRLCVLVILGGVIAVTIYNWIITAWALGAIVAFEIICLIGRHN